MSKYINSNTNLNGLVITNDYPCITSGTWTAQLVDGKTVYTNGTTTYDGPVNFLGGTLTVTSGAVVDGLVSYVTSTTKTATIIVKSGGVLENSDIINTAVTVQNGGTSNGNNYVGSTLTLVGATSATSAVSTVSTGDSFYNSAASGTITSTNTTSGTASSGVSFSVAEGKSGLVTNSTNSFNINVSGPHFVAPASGGTTSTSMGMGTSFGNADVANKGYADQI